MTAAKYSGKGVLLWEERVAENKKGPIQKGRTREIGSKGLIQSLWT